MNKGLLKDDDDGPDYCSVGGLLNLNLPCMICLMGHCYPTNGERGSFEWEWLVGSINIVS